MSDSAQGAGWWQASDGYWYPPDRHGDPAHQARWRDDAPPVPPVVPVHRSDSVMPLDVGPLPLVEPRPDLVLPERPPYLPHGMEPPVPAEPAPTTLVDDAPPVDWPLYDHPVLPEPEPVPDPHNRLVGIFIVAAALVVVAASLLPWVTFDGGPVGGDSSGWFRGEGRATVVAGVVLAAAGGAIAGGARRLWIKLVAMVAAVFIIVVFAIDVVDISMEADDLVQQGTPVDLDQGYGLWMLGAAGITAFVLTLVERSPWSRRS